MNMSDHSEDKVSDHEDESRSIDNEVTFKDNAQVSDESKELEDEHVPLQDLKGMSMDTLSAYFDHRERLLERQQRAKLEMMEQKLKHERELAMFEHQKEMEKLRYSQEKSQAKEVENGISYKGPKVPKFVEGQDIDSYLHTYEKLAEVYEWPAETWATRLAALLSGKALEAYARMDKEESKNYNKVKRAILKRYELTSEAYRKKFRTSKRMDDETFAEWAVRMTRYLSQWIESEDLGGVNENEDGNNALKDLFIREQLLENSPLDLRVWLKERKLKTVKEMVELGDQYLVSHPRMAFADKNSKKVVSNSLPSNLQGNPQSKKDDRRCYKCNRRGHIAADCRSEFAKPKKGYLSKGNVYQRNELDPGLAQYRQRGTINGKNVLMLRDTGCTKTLVHARLVPKKCIIPTKWVDICLADGSSKRLPLAKVHISVQGKQGYMEVGIVETLPENVLLGNDIDQDIEKALITTRSKAREEKEKTEMEKQNIKASEVKPREIISTDEINSKLSKNNDKKSTIDLQPRETADEMNTDDIIISDLGTDKIIELQRKDKSLSKIIELANMDNDLQEGETRFYFDDKGILCREWHPRTTGGQIIYKQLVVPLACRRKILNIAHDIPLAGHPGIERTKARVLKNFYWPGVFNDVAKYCRTCSVCQKSSKKPGYNKVPLISVPVVSEPFKKVAIDIVGPLPKSKKNNRYILTLVDYATRYPEAIAIPTIDTERIAEELIQIFSRVGLPDEILTDQGSNFTSQLMKDICKLLAIKKLRTTPYHPMCNGLVERFNGVLKTMLKKYVSSQPSQWDAYLPYLLFAYREVPQASTGFSPFELLYGRKVRGPLDLIYESWTGEAAEDENMVKYILDMRHNLSNMAEIAKENMEVQQERQKYYYDKKARMRSYSAGDKVLILLPSDSSKLKATWKGPYTIVRKINNVDYEVRVGGPRGIQSFHVNLLRKWENRQNAFYGVIEGTSEIRSTKTAKYQKETWEDVKIEESLTETQREEVRGLLREFSDILTDLPGKTSLIEHDIKMQDTEVIRQRPYRIPQTKIDIVKKEIDQLLELGIIVESHSSFASPIVLVPKPDQSTRVCIDFRKLNQKSKFDAYPIGRIDDLLENISTAHYITKLDFSKGYHQIPLTSTSAEKTAFITPFGLYEYKFMPFGLASAPATFMRLMDKVLAGAKEYAHAYFDDTSVFSDDWETHLDHLRDIFTRIRNANLTIRPSKCFIGGQEVSVVGHVVGKGKIRTQPEKITSIKNYPIPKTKKDIRAFLGLAGYYRKHVNNFSTIALALTDLTKKGKPNIIQWTKECDISFNKLKSALSKEPVLMSPNFDKHFYVQVDASDRGLGCVLSQLDENGCDHPVIYLSRKLIDREVNYPTVEKECLGIVWAVQQLRYYLLGRTFTIQTDHAPLTWLERVKTKNQKLLRWSLTLQEYSYILEHRSGKLNDNADGLSRGF